MKEKNDGMTVNERLFAVKKLDEFDEAVGKKDVDKIISILKSVDLANESIYPILESLSFSNSDKGGICLMDKKTVSDILEDSNSLKE